MPSYKSTCKKSQSGVDQRFRVLVNRTCCPYAKVANIRYAPKWDQSRTIRENVLALLPYLDQFVERSEEEELDMFVIEVRDNKFIKDINAFASLVYNVLDILHEVDPTSEGTFTDGITSMEWDFVYRNVEFFIPTFTPFYDSNHIRYSHQKDSAFIAFQPDHCFDRHGINSKNPNRRQITEKVRERFEKAGIEYDVSLVSGSIKAVRYIKPLKTGQSLIRWWEDPKSYST